MEVGRSSAADAGCGRDEIKGYCNAEIVCVMKGRGDGGRVCGGGGRCCG